MTNNINRTNYLPQADGSAFSSLDQVGQCLMDRARSEAFDRAFRSVVFGALGFKT